MMMMMIATQVKWSMGEEATEEWLGAVHRSLINYDLVWVYVMMCSGSRRYIFWDEEAFEFCRS